MHQHVQAVGSKLITTWPVQDICACHNCHCTHPGSSSCVLCSLCVCPLAMQAIALQEKGIKVIDEDGMLALMAASAPAAPQQQPPTQQMQQTQQQGAAGRLAPMSDSAFHGGSKPVPALAALGQALAVGSQARAAQAGPSRGGAGASTPAELPLVVLAGIHLIDARDGCGGLL